MASDPSELIGHVQDSTSIHFPWGMHWDLPAFEIPLFGHTYKFELTKFMLVEVVVAVLLVLAFAMLARKVAGGKPPRGKFWNLLEMMLLFLRDEVARPAIGRHDADRFLPFIWTVFFFILGVNLVGLFPWFGSATGALGTTGALAAITFVAVIGAGMRKYGAVGFWLGQVPHMDIPVYMAVFVKPMIFFIEVLGMGVKHFILAMRLFANMFAGHLVLAVIMGFIAMTAQSWLWYGVMPSSVFGAVALSLLELMVAFLQAYVFTFLAALFIGMAVHQH